jgi:hypothetical protein
VAAVAAVLEDVVEVIAVKAEGKSCMDFSLADSVTDRETGRDFIAESDITELVNIDEYDESQIDGADLLEHLLEKDGELANIKSLAFIHTASKDFRAVPHEITDSFNDCPGTHVCRDPRLVGKLEIMKAKDISK